MSHSLIELIHDSLGGEMESKKVTAQDRLKLKEYGFSESKMDLCRILEFQQGEFLYMAGFQWNYVIIIQSGKAKVCSTTSSGKVMLSCIYEDEGIMGDVELLGEKEVAITTVEAITIVTGIGIPAQLSREECKENTKFVYMLGKELSLKLEKTGMNATTAVLNPLETRLCDYIYQTQIDGIFLGNLTELSEILGVSYRHLLRTFKNLTMKNILVKEKKKYRIENMQELASLANKL